ncbi:hypothetical protein SNE40_018483 [Patella caerulea]
MTDVRSVTNGLYVYNVMSEDFDAKLIGINTLVFNPGQSSVPTGHRQVQDFNTKKQYSITPQGCNVSDIVFDLQGPCVPDNAEYLGSNYFGYGVGSLKYDAYRFTLEKTDANITVIFTQGDCIPVLEGVSGVINGVAVDSTYTFTTYEKEIQDRSIFNIPSSCQQS